MKHENLIGRVFDRLFVFEKCLSAAGRRQWHCRCVCGKELKIATAYLTTGNTRSCGCLRVDTVRKIRTTHGQSNRNKTVEYATWLGINYRCFGEHCKAFENYGGRGITVCSRWRGVHGFQNFLVDMGTRPSARHSIDRINNDGNYEPENCRWATPLQQVLNRRRVIKNAPQSQNTAIG